MRVTESIRILLDAHEHEIAWADGALAATQVSTPTGDLFYAEQCGRLTAIAGSYQAQLHLLYKRLREIVAEEGRS